MVERSLATEASDQIGNQAERGSSSGMHLLSADRLVVSDCSRLPTQKVNDEADSDGKMLGSWIRG